MAIFHFYVKDNAPVHLDVDSSSFLQEKDQLVAQGFERVGDIVQADSVEDAYEKFKTLHLDELKDFTHTHLLVATAGIFGYLSES